jgi:hypothetical protein
MTCISAPLKATPVRLQKVCSLWLQLLCIRVSHSFSVVTSLFITLWILCPISFLTPSHLGYVNLHKFSFFGTPTFHFVLYTHFLYFNFRVLCCGFII